MAGLTFRPLDEAGMRLYASWFDDAELKRRIEAPTPRWFEYVTTTPGSYAWLVYDGEHAIGSVQMDTDAERKGWFGLVVKPTLRRRGYGTRILQAFLRRPEVTALRQLEAEVELDNLAALRCCQRVGFVQTDAGPDDDGFLHLTYELTPTQ